jgi:hypothetical protein
MNGISQLYRGGKTLLEQLHGPLYRCSNLENETLTTFRPQQGTCLGILRKHYGRT